MAGIEPRDLLIYLPEYRVLICDRCRYAVPPKALSRHLKDIHHILRNTRTPFLEYADTLDLATAEEVIISKPSILPVPSLPLEDGLACNVDGCLHLCVTLKRMQNHWRLEHGDRRNEELAFRNVKIQTFFRGNRLRYFTGPVLDEKLQGTDSISVKHIGPLDPTSNRLSDQSLLEDANVEATVSKTLDPSLSKEALLELFINRTSLTLADHEGHDEIWQKTIPELARGFDYLMNGILMVAAIHLTVLNRTSPHRKRLYSIASWYQNEAMPHFRAELGNINEHNCHAVFAFTHLVVIHSLASEDLDSDSDFLFFIQDRASSTYTVPLWLDFLRGTCAVLGRLNKVLWDGPLQGLLSVWAPYLSRIDFEHNTLLDRFQTVLPLIENEKWDTRHEDLYTEAAVVLAKGFARVEILGKNLTIFDILSIFAEDVPRDYIILLRDGHPGAMIILSNYCPLLNRLQHKWYVNTLGERLSRRIKSKVDKRYHPWLNILV